MRSLYLSGEWLFFASWLKTQHNVSFLALTMAPNVSLNIRPSIFSSILAVLFVKKYKTYLMLICNDVLTTSVLPSGLLVP